MRISALVDNYCPRRDFIAEHGLSLFIETGQANFIFDCGQRDLFLKNAQILGLDLNSLDGVILSHGHYDHGGGLAALYQNNSPQHLPLYVGEGVSEARYVSRGSDYSFIGLPPEATALIADGAKQISEITQITDDFYLLPKAGQANSVSPRLVQIHDGLAQPDRFNDELSLLITSREGLIVITGCAHRGIAEIVQTALAAFPQTKLAALIGGFHLVDANPEQLNATVEALKSLDIKQLFCGHCTGLNGYAALAARLPGRVSWLYCGCQIEFFQS